MPIQEVTMQTFQAEVLQSELPVLLQFTAEWCGPCKTVAPELEAVQLEVQGKAKVLKVDIDRSPEIAQQMGVKSVPTFVVFNQGQPAGGKSGALRKAELMAMLEPVLPRAAGALKPEEVAKLLKQGHVCMVDTRGDAVHARAHLPGAISVPLEDLTSRVNELITLPASPVLYCRSGDKTQALSAELGTQGMPFSFLEGGVLGWEGAGFSLDRPD